MLFKTIIASVKPEYTDKIVNAAKEAGATGATILSGRGTGCHEAKSFFGLTLEPQSDIILMLIEEHLVQGILDAIVEAGEFNKPGTGMAFVLPVEQVVGLESQLDIIKAKIENQYF
jgi:nitrogen regulatory protein PII